MKKIAVLLVLILMCSLLPSMALAAPSVKKVDIDIEKAIAEAVSGRTDVVLPKVEGTENLVVNGGFEDLDENKIAKNWTSRCWNMENKTGASVVTDDPHSGKYCLKLVGGDIPANYPFAQQSFQTMGKALYQMSCWIKKEGNAAMTVKLEFWPEMLPGASTVQEGNTFQIPSTGGQWQQVTYNFIAPFTAKSVGMLARLHDSSGEECYFDDIEVYMVRPPKQMNVEPDCNFYYPEQTKGYATASVLTDFYPKGIGGTVDFALLDGETVLYKEDGVKVDENANAVFNYETKYLTELKKEYTIRAVLKSKDGEVLTEEKEPIYKFNRPNWMKADGTFQADGEEPFYPVLCYSVWSETFFPYLQKAGVNVVQSGEGYLDIAEKHGMKVLMVLYGGMNTAGSEANRQSTIDTVTKYKDDPRVFAWAVMDEPYLNMPDPDDELRESYRLIRSIDDNHPVYICEASPGYYENTVKCVDLLCIDPYLPGSTTVANSGKMNTTHVYERTQQARAASNYLKPVVSVLQAFRWYGYMPDANAERHMIYQTILGGTSGIGYYSAMNVDTENGVKVNLWGVTSNDLWQGICDWGENEKEDILKHFTLKEYGGFSHYVGKDVMYHGYIKDNYLYMIVLNQSITDTVEAEIPLESFDGSIVIDNYFGEYLYGGEGKNIKGKDKMLPVTLAPNAAVVLKVSPRKSTDFSKLDQNAFWAYFESVARSGMAPEEEVEQPQGPHFTDLESYDWASEAIEALYKEGIINEKGEGEYAPAANITRGDFAMFLVNTLGLTAENAEENFDDVDPEAEYAEAIAIGRAAGVLNGVGDNKYLPEAEITRQDLMTICYRGIMAVKELEEAPMLSADNFPDWGSVAEYAQAGISAMVKNEIVKGNADGTLNPIGNTTRAEAAVIMQRMKNLKG